MATIIEGNILDVKEGAVFHQVNCKGKMGSGVAGQIAKRYPKVYNDYKKKCESKEDKDLLGGIQSVKVSDKLYVIKSFTQLNYGRNSNLKYTDEDKLIKNIKQAVYEGNKKGIKVYIPYLIGCGLGNGNWDNVYESIKDLEITIVKYK